MKEKFNVYLFILNNGNTSVVASRNVSDATNAIMDKYGESDSKKFITSYRLIQCTYYDPMSYEIEQGYSIITEIKSN